MVVDYPMLLAHERLFLKNIQAFLCEQVMPYHHTFANDSAKLRMLLEQLAAYGCFASYVNRTSKDEALSNLAIGLTIQLIAKISPLLASLVVVHTMVCYSLERWGDVMHKEEYLPKLLNMDLFAAFALSEPDWGSDMAAIASEATFIDDKKFVVNGVKTWISGGQLADIFLFFAKTNGKGMSLLLRRETVGLSLLPITNMAGFAASMLATLCCNDCMLPSNMLVGKLGFGLSHVANAALDLGRYLVAWLSLGIMTTCIDKSVDYTNRRVQFGKLLKEHQLIKKKLAAMLVQWQTAQLMCRHVAELRDRGSLDALMQTNIAKYFVAKALNAVADDALQIHGATGFTDDSAIYLHLLDARVTNIIEGSAEIQEVIIADYTSSAWTFKQELHFDG